MTVQNIEHRGSERIETYQGMDINDKLKIQSFYSIESSKIGCEPELKASEILCGATVASSVRYRSDQIPDNKNPVYRRRL